MHTTTRRLRQSTVALALSALVLSGCGDVTDEPGAGGDATSAEVTGDPTDATSDGTGEETTTDDESDATQPDASATSDAPDDVEATSSTAAAIQLEQDSIAGVSLPADPNKLLGALVAELGQPTKDEELQGCAGGDGGVLRSIAWGGFRVSGMAEDEDSLRITSWEVRDEAPDEIALPHDLAIGDSQQEAVAALPGGKLFEDGMPHGGSMILKDELRVLLDGQDDLVLEVNAHSGSTSCD
jgi:hypothetical protein